MKNRLKVSPQAKPEMPANRFRHVWIIVIGISVLIGIACIIRITGEHTPVPLIAETRRTSEDLKAFWDRELQELVVEQLTAGKLPYPEINERYSALTTNIVSETGKPLAVTMSTLYHWADKAIEASSRFNETNNTYAVELYIPSIVDTFEQLRAGGGAKWREAFQSHMIVCFMHEMEHTLDKIRVKKFSTAEESRAWADTCRYTLVPLFELNNAPLIESDVQFYRAWRQSNGDTNSFLWTQMLKMRYGDLDGKSYPKK